MAAKNIHPDGYTISELNYLHDLKVGEKQDWDIKITVTRKWAETDSDGRVQGMNFIFVDKCDNRAHAWIPSNNVDLLADKLIERCYYMVSNFSVEPYNQKNRCFEAEHHIILNTETLITSLDDEYSECPKDVFLYTNLRKLMETPYQETHLIDVVGIVEQMQPFEPVDGPRNEKHFYKEFFLSDHFNRVRVRFWDDFALHFQSCYLEFKKNPTIITISSCKILKNGYNGEITLRNVPATRIFLKYHSSTEDTLRKRLWEVYGLE